MGERVQLKVWVDADVKEAFEKFVVETHGQKRGHMSEEAEKAISEYVDHDRYARIDDKLDRVLDRLDDADATHTHKRTATAAKVEKIAEALGETGRTVIKADTVRRAIEGVAGADDRTVEKYRRQLKRRGLAYEHPTDEVWTVDREQWATWAENHVDQNPTVEVHDVTEDYPIDYDEYDRLTTDVAGVVQ